MSLDVKLSFDNNTYRHYINGHLAVLHCHHYMSLTTKLAEDLHDIGGTQILCEVAEDSIRPLLDDYIQVNDITSIEDRLKIGEEYYSFMGLGKMEVTATENGGDVKLIRSHVDEGWIKKWDKSASNINHVTRGFLAAMFAAAHSKPPRSFNVVETSSIVAGDEQSSFIVKAE